MDVNANSQWIFGQKRDVQNGEKEHELILVRWQTMHVPDSKVFRMPFWCEKQMVIAQKPATY
jgi:hypothetical protein